MQQKFFDAYSQAKSRLLLLDYDGTLAPLAPTPEQAKPTAELLQLLQTLAKNPKNDVVIISGRDHRTLDEWLGHLPIDFAAEHGLFIKKHGGAWQETRDTNEDWKRTIGPLFERYARALPGAIVEETTGTLNWHYRRADAAAGRTAAEQLLEQIQPIAKQLGVALLDGNKVVVVKLAGIDKGTVVSHWLTDKTWDFILAAGDDTTDEYMFKAMPPNAFTLKIGPGESVASIRINSVHDMIQTLQQLD